LFTFLALQDQSWMGTFYRNRLEARTEQFTQKLVEYSGKSLGATAASSDGQAPAGSTPSGSGAGQGTGGNSPFEPRWGSAAEWLPNGRRTTQSPAAVVR
jgi:hypothetical protein